MSTLGFEILLRLIYILFKRMYDASLFSEDEKNKVNDLMLRCAKEFNVQDKIKEKLI